MKNKLTIGILIVLLLLSLNVNASKELANESIRVIANIPVFQEMEVIKPIYIGSIDNEFKNKNFNKPVIIKNAGEIRVKSNAHWRLEITNTSLPENFEVKIKVDGSSVWKDVFRGNINIFGENGDHLLNFDLKLISKGRENKNSGNSSVNFNYTLVQI